MDDALRYVDDLKKQLEEKLKTEVEKHDQLDAELKALTQKLQQLGDENVLLDKNRNQALADMVNIKENQKPEYDLFFEDNETKNQLEEISKVTSDLKKQLKENDALRMSHTKTLTEW